MSVEKAEGAGPTAPALKTPSSTAVSTPGTAPSVHGLPPTVAVEALSSIVVGQLPRLVTTIELVETVERATEGSSVPRWMRLADGWIWKLSRVKGVALDCPTQLRLATWK